MKPLRDIAKPVEASALTLADLTELWETSDGLQLQYIFSASSIPTVVNIDDLRLEHNIHDNTVFEVSFAADEEDEFRRRYVYKTVRENRSYRYLYHEIRNLLIKVPHKYIIPAPTHLVFCESQENRPYMGPPIGTHLICGFLSPKLSGQDLDKTIRRKSTEGTLDLSTQLKWCCQLTEALHHVYRHGYGENRPSFYSELKPNNVFIKEPDEDVLLLDFEQKEGWEEYTAPEVLHHHRSVKSKSPGYEISKFKYDGAVFGFFRFWTEVKQRNKELATVFSLGRVFCAILDGSGCVSDQVEAKGKKWRPKLGGEQGSVSEIPKAIRKLVHVMVTRYPKKARPTLAEVIRYLHHHENNILSNPENPVDAESKRKSFCGDVGGVQHKCGKKRKGRNIIESGVAIGPLDWPSFFARDTVREAAKNKWLPTAWKSLDKVSRVSIQQTRCRRTHIRRLLRLKQKRASIRVSKGVEKSVCEREVTPPQ